MFCTIYRKVANANARKISLDNEVKQQFSFEMADSPAYKFYSIYYVVCDEMEEVLWICVQIKSEVAFL